MKYEKLENALFDFIGELPDGDEIGKAVAEKLADAMGMELVEKQSSPECKIDGDEFRDWHIIETQYGDSGCVGDAKGVHLNNLYARYTDIGTTQNKLIANSPDTMREVIDFLDAYKANNHGRVYPPWLVRMEGILRNRVIATGFGCDLQ